MDGGAGSEGEGQDTGSIVRGELSAVNQDRRPDSGHDSPFDEADRLLAVMRRHPLGQNAAVIGTVVADHPGMVTMRTLVGGERVVTMLAGEQLPRIC